jgi:DNA-directed RNA polymerase specialized sigma subunit
MLDQYIKHTRRGIERAAFVLAYKWELTLKEIGHVFGMSESGASIRLAEATSRVERAIRRDK